VEVDPQKVEVDPQKVEVDPQKLEVDPQKVDVDPQKLEVDLQKVDVDPQKLEVDLQKLEVDLQKVNVDPQKLNFQVLISCPHNLVTISTVIAPHPQPLPALREGRQSTPLAGWGSLSLISNLSGHDITPSSRPVPAPLR